MPPTPAGPLLVLVTGHPCTGKSTLADALARHLGLPVLGKDELQEALFDAGWPPGAGAGPAVAANHALLRAARRMLANGIDCLVESNLDPARWRQPVAALLADTGARLMQVRCSAEGPRLVQRFSARASSRHPGHADAARLASLSERLLGPPLAPLELPGAVLEFRSDHADAAAVCRVAEAISAARAHPR